MRDLLRAIREEMLIHVCKSCAEWMNDGSGTFLAYDCADSFLGEVDPFGRIPLNIREDMIAKMLEDFGSLVEQGEVTCDSRTRWNDKWQSLRISNRSARHAIDSLRASSARPRSAVIARVTDGFHSLFRMLGVRT